MKINSLYFLLLLCSIGLVSCGDDDDGSAPSTQVLTLNFDGLPNVGPNYAYEGWIMVNGSPKTTGVFTVDDAGNLSQSTFTLDQSDLTDATAFILTIEPSPDNDASPSDVHIFAGDFSGNSAQMSVGHPAALGHDFQSSTGGYILATPTNGADNEEESGVWFLDNSSGSPMAGLDLPTLPAGWMYEGWAVIDGMPVSTGTFTSLTMADNSSTFSGSSAGPPFPGEDFLTNAPSGLTFPTDLRGGTIVISVEPFPDNSPAPFVLKPLVGQVPTDAALHQFINMSNNASATNPTGSVTR